MAREDPFQDYASPRRDVEAHIRSGLHGFYFASGDAILDNRYEDEGLLQALCPADASNNTAEDVSCFISNVLRECVKSLHVLEARGAVAFWTKASVDSVYTSSRSTIARPRIKLNPMMLRDMTTALMKARHRYLIRQSAIYPDFNMKRDVVGFRDGLAQRLFQHVESLDDPTQFSGDVFKKPLCSRQEEADLRKSARPVGPVKQISSKKFELNTHAPHKLYPISGFSGGTKTSNCLAFTETITGQQSTRKHTTEPDLKLTTPAKRRITPTQRNVSEGHSRIGRRKPQYLLDSPTRRKSMSRARSISLTRGSGNALMKIEKANAATTATSIDANVTSDVEMANQ
ncbi:hypothetical protein QQS21_001175 [Conoideocrella luteorostrata]|uniref:Uncharacterized protein n=1 Tax=Conoideocrella luteorostrata TaxID=1105319 RepID=A0AAJ0CZY0_9HYPO|nr:hypothetical protein QQS21_001175 [Conoideocrella luteorostrata]